MTTQREDEEQDDAVADDSATTEPKPTKKKKTAPPAVESEQQPTPTTEELEKQKLTADQIRLKKQTADFEESQRRATQAESERKAKLEQERARIEADQLKAQQATQILEKSIQSHKREVDSFNDSIRAYTDAVAVFQKRHQLPASDPRRLVGGSPASNAELRRLQARQQGLNTFAGKLRGDAEKLNQDRATIIEGQASLGGRIDTFNEQVREFNQAVEAGGDARDVAREGIVKGIEDFKAEAERQAGRPSAQERLLQTKGVAPIRKPPVPPAVASGIPGSAPIEQQPPGATSGIPSTQVEDPLDAGAPNSGVEVNTETQLLPSAPLSQDVSDLSKPGLERADVDLIPADATPVNQDELSDIESQALISSQVMMPDPAAGSSISTPAFANTDPTLGTKSKGADFGITFVPGVTPYKDMQFITSDEFDNLRWDSKAAKVAEFALNTLVDITIVGAVLAGGIRGTISRGAGSVTEIAARTTPAGLAELEQAALKGVRSTRISAELSADDVAAIARRVNAGDIPNRGIVVVADANPASVNNAVQVGRLLRVNGVNARMEMEISAFEAALSADDVGRLATAIRQAQSQGLGTVDITVRVPTANINTTELAFAARNAGVSADELAKLTLSQRRTAEVAARKAMDDLQKATRRTIGGDTVNVKFEPDVRTGPLGDQKRITRVLTIESEQGAAQAYPFEVYSPPSGGVVVVDKSTGVSKVVRLPDGGIRVPVMGSVALAKATERITKTGDAPGTSKAELFAPTAGEQETKIDTDSFTQFGSSAALDTGVRPVAQPEPVEQATPELPSVQPVTDDRPRETGAPLLDPDVDTPEVGQPDTPVTQPATDPGVDTEPREDDLPELQPQPVEDDSEAFDIDEFDTTRITRTREVERPAPGSIPDPSDGASGAPAPDIPTPTQPVREPSTDPISEPDVDSTPGPETPEPSDTPDDFPLRNPFAPEPGDTPNPDPLTVTSPTEQEREFVAPFPDPLTDAIPEPDLPEEPGLPDTPPVSTPRRPPGTSSRRTDDGQRTSAPPSRSAGRVPKGGRHPRTIGYRKGMKQYVYIDLVTGARHISSRPVFNKVPTQGTPEQTLTTVRFSSTKPKNRSFKVGRRKATVSSNGKRFKFNGRRR